MSGQLLALAIRHMLLAHWLGRHQPYAIGSLRLYSARYSQNRFRYSIVFTRMFKAVVRQGRSGEQGRGVLGAR
jgi:hypothetical protein